MGWRIFGLVVACLVVAARSANAHPLAPAVVLVEQEAAGEVRVRFKRPAVQPRGARLRLAMDPGCTPRGAERVESSDEAVTTDQRFHCAAGLVGRSIGVDGLGEAELNGLVRVTLANGRTQRALLEPSRAAMRVTAAPSVLSIAWGYLRMGVGHLWTGLDHVLFVLSLLLVAVAGERSTRRLRAVGWALTAFTAGHSVTLALAVLGVIAPPAVPVEVAIALSLMLVAARVVHPPEGAARPRGLWLMAGACGLLHGLGFAGALRDGGLPEGDVPLALGMFNLGIELGQLAIVAAAWAVARATARWLPSTPRWRRVVPGYALGSVAGMWCVERAAALFG